MCFPVALQCPPTRLMLRTDQSRVSPRQPEPGRHYGTHGRSPRATAIVYNVGGKTAPWCCRHVQDMCLHTLIGPRSAIVADSLLSAPLSIQVLWLTVHTASSASAVHVRDSVTLITGTFECADGAQGVAVWASVTASVGTGIAGASHVCCT
jgi:hypothetical protein